MKNLSFILGVVLSLFLAGCTSDEPVQAPVPDTQAKSTTIRTESEAIELAQAIADARVGESRAYDLAPQATSSVKVVYGNSSRAATDTLIYAVDYADQTNRPVEPV